MTTLAERLAAEGTLPGDVEVVGGSITPPPDPAPAAGDAAADAPAATVELRGQTFRVHPEGLPFMALMDLADVARTVTDSGGVVQADDVAGIAALYDTLQDAVHPDDWQRFRKHARRARATGLELMGVVRAAVAVTQATPTQPPPASPAGRRPTAASSPGGSSSPATPIVQGDLRVQRQLEEQGRPDVALVVKRAREAAASSTR